MPPFTRQSAVADRVSARTRAVDPLRDLFASILGMELAAALSALGSVRALDLWIESFYPRHDDAIARAARPVVESYGGELVEIARAEIDAGPVDAAHFTEGFTAGLASRWTSSSIGQLRQIIRDEDDPIPAVVARLERWEESRALRTAASEATQAAGAFTKYAYLVGGQDELVWVALGSSCPLCRKMAGRRIRVTEDFLAPGDTLTAEGEEGPVEFVPQKAVGHPPLHGISSGGGICDCTVRAA